ncbi:hypothetical protein BKA61DRAFT_652001 [Leptodontidium sp. MPI-SDFR-AT-0119]|nr:hypothetical protein BKA61DRAFT_652001 [Leptodontidium sp. MPI-SDFR-AT-0119]
MPSTRASERAAAEESEGGRKSKRARKPNPNSTAAFSANQPLIARKTKRKRRDTASEPAEKDAEDMPDIPTPKPLPKKSAGKRDTPDVIDVESSPIPSRPKLRPKPEFDPSALGDEPYRVSLTFTTVLNRKAVAQGEIKLDAIWKTIERDETPPPISGAVGPKGKGKGKGRLDTVQMLRFGRSQDVESSDKEGEDDDDGIDTPTTSKPRDSVTERARALKKSVDDSDNPLESTRKLIFNVNACHDERCLNNPGCCYITEKGEHYKVTLLEQVRWAKLAVAGEQRVTIQRPPEEFLRVYLSGHNLMSWRTTGKRKSNQTTEETALKPDQKDS